MSSRQQEKEQRQQERLAREQAAKAAPRRQRRLRQAGSATIAAAAVAAVVLSVSSSDRLGSSSGTPTSHPVTGVTLPKQRITDLHAAAQVAGCQLHDYPNFGRTHLDGSLTYKTNPPTSGNHNPVPASDGVYDPGKEPAKEHLVHSLEHGRVEIQYRPGTPMAQVKELEALFKEPLKGQAGYKELLFRNDTNMPFAVAAVAWTHLLGCPTFNAGVIDAIRTFRATYVDQGPEDIPFPE